MKLIYVNTVLLIAVLIYLIIGNLNVSNKEAQVYVVTAELFGEFDYQKELDSEYKSFKEDKIKELEFLKNDVSILETRARMPEAATDDIQLFQNSYNQYLAIEAQINAELSELNNKYSIQIWDKLNSLISDFGEENDYEIILGATGDGNILYAHDHKNVTQDLIAYCNLKYNGKL